MIQQFLSAIIVEEWAREYSLASPTPTLIDSSPLARDLSTKILHWLQGNPPASYHEMTFALNRIHADSVGLLQLFVTDCKLPSSSIPYLGSDIDITGTNPRSFSIDTAQIAVGTLFNQLKDRLGRTKKKELAVLSEKRNKVVGSIERYLEVKTQYDIRVSAAFAAAFVAVKSPPEKVSPVVKGIMNGIKV